MKTLKFIFAVVVVALILGGCKYDFIVPVEIPEPDENNPVSFATQIVPIFTTDNCISCHFAGNGGHAPDLTSANVYSEIVPALVNTSDPESSIIYDYPSPSTDKHAWKKYSPAQAAYILNWIKEGAKNN